VLPLRPTDRIDIVPADYVGKAIVHIHQKAVARYPRYHLSSGAGSQTYRELTDALAQAGGSRPTYLPSLGGTFSGTVNWLSHKKKQPWPWRFAVESLLALPGLEHGVR